MDDLPITGQPSAESQSDGSDFYIAVLSRGMASLEYATYLGGYDPGNPYGDHVDGGTSRINARGILFQSVCATCGVCNNCPDPDKQGSFPTTPNAYSDLNVRGNCSNALVKYDLDGAELFPGFEASLPRCGTVPEVRFTDQSQGADSVLWLFGDGSFSKARNPVHQFDSSGRYRVLQVVYNERSCNPADSLSREIIVAEKPATRLKTKIGCGNRVEFRYLGEAAPSEIVWWLGNGESVTTDTPFLSYTYADTGSYSVSAYASYAQNDRYCDDTLERTVRVHPPRALFEAEGQHCSRTVAFEAQSPGPSRWAFGDGNTSEEPNPRHTYADTGRYTVRLVIYPDQAQCRDTFSRSVYVAGAPSNQLTYTFDSCLSQGTFTSQNQAEAEVLWIFGGTDTAEGRSVAYHFRDTGRFEVRMVTRPELACADTQRTQVDIGSGGFALWAVDSLLPCQQAVRLRNQSSAFDSVRWRVGDTIVSRSPHPRLEFASSGFYRLSLQAFLSNGCVDTFAREIQIPDRPEAGFRLQRPECPNAVEAQSEQVAKGESVLWRWGDGTATLGDAARHYYASAGRYTIQQVVRNPNGCSDTATMDFLVEATSKAGLAYEWQTCGKALRVADRSEGAQAYQWSLMSRADTTDLGTDSVLLLRELPSSAFKLRLLINPGLACADTAIQTVERPRISADALQLPNIITPNGDRRNDRWRIDWRQAPQNDFFESGCLDITLKVFNRWGELLHRREQDSFPLEWDGHARGSRVESGTYYYFLTVGPETFRGSLTVTY
jgi:gliding motility-associated-like protein